MKTISVTEYKGAIQHLSPRRIEILQTFFHCPNSSATAPELAAALGYRGFQGVNRHIGGIGEAIANHLRLKRRDLLLYSKPLRPAYFAVVGGEDYVKGLGWTMTSNLKKALISLGLVAKRKSSKQGSIRLPTELQAFAEKQALREGQVVTVLVNRYERNIHARNQCLKHHGHRCVGCGFDFGDVYGENVRGFIHVHHLLPLSEIGKDYQIDPINDLVPLCPNCHSVVHLSKPALTIQQLRKLVRKVRNVASI